MFPIMFGSPAWKSSLIMFPIMFPTPLGGPWQRPLLPWAQIGMDRISEITYDALGKQPKMILKK